MRTSRWLTIALLLSLVPACGFGSSDEELAPSETASRTEQTPRRGQTATVGADQANAATILSAYTGTVSFVAWSPDGTLLATAPDGYASGDVTSRLWDAGGTLIAELTSDGGGATGQSWSGDGSLLAVAGADGTVRLWNRDGTPASTVAVSGAGPSAPFSISAIAWSPTDALLATASILPRDSGTPGQANSLPARVTLWQPDGSVVRSFEIEHTFRGTVRLAWSDDGSLLAAGGNNLHVWETTGAELLTVPGGEFDFVPAMAFSPDGTYLAYIDMTGRLNVYGLDGRSPMSSAGFGGAAALAFSPDSTRIAIATETLLLVVPSDNPLSVPVGVVTNGVQGNPVWSPDGQRLAIGQARRAVQVATPDGSTLAVLAGCEGFVRRLAWSPDGASLAAGLDDGRVCLWDVATD